MIAVPELQITRVERSKLADINLENLPSGIYFVSVISEEKRAVAKVILE